MKWTCLHTQAGSSRCCRVSIPPVQTPFVLLSSTLLANRTLGSQAWPTKTLTRKFDPSAPPPHTHTHKNVPHWWARNRYKTPPTLSQAHLSLAARFPTTSLTRPTPTHPVQAVTRHTHYPFFSILRVPSTILQKLQLSSEAILFVRVTGVRWFAGSWFLLLSALSFDWPLEGLLDISALGVSIMRHLGQLPCQWRAAAFSTILFCLSFLKCCQFEIWTLSLDYPGYYTFSIGRSSLTAISFQFTSTRKSTRCCVILPHANHLSEPANSLIFRSTTPHLLHISFPTHNTAQLSSHNYFPSARYGFLNRPLPVAALLFS